MAIPENKLAFDGGWEYAPAEELLPLKRLLAERPHALEILFAMEASLAATLVAALERAQEQKQWIYTPNQWTRVQRESAARLRDAHEWLVRLRTAATPYANTLRQRSGDLGAAIVRAKAWAKTEANTVRQQQAGAASAARHSAASGTASVQRAPGSVPTPTGSCGSASREGTSTSGGAGTSTQGGAGKVGQVAHVAQAGAAEPP